MQIICNKVLEAIFLPCKTVKMKRQDASIYSFIFPSHLWYWRGFWLTIRQWHDEIARCISLHPPSLSVCLSLSLSHPPPISLSLCLSVSFSLSVCLSAGLLGRFAPLSFVLCTQILRRFAPSGSALCAHVLGHFASWSFAISAQENFRTTLML